MPHGSADGIIRLKIFRADGLNLSGEILLFTNPCEAASVNCLPAHCGEEITEDVLWGESSAVWDEAENRLHAQKALLAMIV